MLYIIGLGLDKEDITLKGINAIKKCKKVYLETYTNVFSYSVKELEKIIGKTIITAGREMIEAKDTIVKESKNNDIALLVSGDPLSATTHFDLLLRCMSQKIKFEIIHSVSVFNAVSETGLQLYKFGKTTSIPKFQKSYHPESFYDVIEDNLKIDAHTLLLLDIGLNVKEALGYIMDISEKRKDKMMERKIIICERLGTSEAGIYYGNLDVLINKNFKLPASIIIPSKLHFVEEEALKKL